MPPTGEDPGQDVERFPPTDLPEFLVIYHRATAGVYRFLCSLTNDEVAAEDLHQETFIRLLMLKHWRKVRPLHPEQQRVWLFRTAWCVFIDKTRRDKRTGWTPLPNEDPPSAEWTTEIDQRIDTGKMLCHLPLEYRAILFLRFVGNLTPAEIGEVLELPPPKGE
jgi:RNA polymerase sigma factor (sigma-70 family)